MDNLFLCSDNPGKSSVEYRMDSLPAEKMTQHNLRSHGVTRAVRLRLVTEVTSWARSFVGHVRGISVDNWGVTHHFSLTMGIGI